MILSNFMLLFLGEAVQQSVLSYFPFPISHSRGDQITSSSESLLVQNVKCVRRDSRRSYSNNVIPFIDVLQSRPHNNAMKRIILVLVTAACLVWPSSCRQLTDLPRKWLSSGGGGAKPTQAPPYLDPCHKERSMKMICHCEHQSRTAHHQQHRQSNDESIRAAECWILKNDLTPHDPLWRSFDKYVTISDLKFIVQSGSLTFLPTAVFKKLINLSELSVSFSNIIAIESFAFANSSALQIIRLNNNNMTKIKKFAFANHNSLERLDLQENELQEIDSLSFANLSRLEYLALNNNKISEINNGTFSALNNLLELQLQHNWIHQIKSEMFRRLENLRVLKLSSNKLKTIGNAAFIDLWSLQELYLDGNRIEV